MADAGCILEFRTPGEEGRRCLSHRRAIGCEPIVADVGIGFEERLACADLKECSLRVFNTPGRIVSGIPHMLIHMDGQTDTSCDQAISFALLWAR